MAAFGLRIINRAQRELVRTVNKEDAPPLLPKAGPAGVIDNGANYSTRGSPALSAISYGGSWVSHRGSPGQGQLLGDWRST